MATVVGATPRGCPVRACVGRWFCCPVRACTGRWFFHRICVFPASAVAPHRPFSWIGKSDTKRETEANTNTGAMRPGQARGPAPTAWWQSHGMTDRHAMDCRGNPPWLPCPRLRWPLVLLPCPRPPRPLVFPPNMRFPRVRRYTAPVVFMDREIGYETGNRGQHEHRGDATRAGTGACPYGMGEIQQKGDDPKERAESNDSAQREG
jgi:hypothetical protein